MHRLAAVLAVLAVLPLATPVALGAQERRDSTAADSSQRVAPVVVTGSRAPAAVGATGAIVIRPDSLRTSPAPVLEEALRETPFVLLRQNSRGEAELSVRGSESRQAAVLLDGIPLTLGWDHRADPSLVPLSGVQSIVVVRGLSSVLLGPNVLGGVVDLGIARGEGAGTAAPRAWGGMGVDQYGSRVLSLGGEAPVAVGRGTLTLRGGGGYREREGFRVTADARDSTAEDELRTNSDLRHYDGFASLRWQSGAGRYLGLTATGFSAERGVPPELHVEEPRLWRYPEQSRVLTALSAGTGAVRTPLGTATVDASAGYNHGRTEIESFTDREYSTVVDTERGDERTLTGRVVASHTLAGGGELRAAFTGSEVRYAETLGDDAPNDYRQRLWSTGAEAQWPVLRRATVGGGVVYDASTTPESGGKASLGRLDTWGWRGGATVAASDALRLHANVSRRARFPALRELYSGALNRFQPNPSLRPEQLTGGELGATFAAPTGAGRASGPVTFQAVGFHHRLRDAVVRTTVPDTRLFVRVNRDEIRSSGVELFGGWESSPDAVRAVSLNADFVAQRVRVHDDSAQAERYAEHQPQVRGALELGVPLPAALRGVTAARYTGTQYCVHPDLGTQVRLGGRTEGNVSVERTWVVRGAGVFGALRTLVALDNLTNATVYDQCGLPQPGRTLRLAIQLR